MEQILMSDRVVGDKAQMVAALFERYHESIFAYLYRLLNEREWAHDLTQETFLRLYETREQLDGVENQRAWVYRIASNLAFNALKRRRRFRWLPWREETVYLLAQDDPASRFPEQSRVAQSLLALSPTYRVPLLLYSSYGFSLREVAAALEISEGAVKTRLHRAREMFRESYEEGN